MTDHPIDHTTATTTALLADLRDALDRPDLDWAAPPVPISGGFWAQIFGIRLAGAPEGLDGDLVARIMPEAEPGHRETVVQREVAAQGYPAPAVRVSGAGVHLGQRFMVMDRVGGAPLMAGLSVGRAIRSLPRMVRRLPQLLAGAALDLHLLDPRPVVDALEREVPGAAIGADDLLAHLAVRGDELGLDLVRAATAWLAAHRLEPERVSICHGDLHPFNLLVDDGAPPGRQVSVIDWTGARIAEPAYDLAFTTLLFRGAPLAVSGPIRPVLRRATGWLAGDILRTYRELGRPHGITVDDDRLAWYTALQSTRILVEVASWPEPRPDHPFAAMAPDLARSLAATIAF